MITCRCKKVTSDCIMCDIDDGENSLELYQSIQSLINRCKECANIVENKELHVLTDVI